MHLCELHLVKQYSYFVYRIVSLHITDLHEPVLMETAVLTMTPNKLEISVRKEATGEITWPQLHESVKPTVKHEGIMNPEPPRPPTINEPIVEEPDDEQTEKMPELENPADAPLVHTRTGGLWKPEKSTKKSMNPRESAEAKRKEYKLAIANGAHVDYPQFDSDEVSIFYTKNANILL